MTSLLDDYLTDDRDQLDLSPLVVAEVMYYIHMYSTDTYRIFGICYMRIGDTSSH